MYEAGSPTQQRFTTKKRARAKIYWPASGEFMRRFALAGGFTRDEKPKFSLFLPTTFRSADVPRFFPPLDSSHVPLSRLPVIRGVLASKLISLIQSPNSINSVSVGADRGGHGGFRDFWRRTEQVLVTNKKNKNIEISSTVFENLVDISSRSVF